LLVLFVGAAMAGCLGGTGTVGSDEAPPAPTVAGVPFNFTLYPDAAMQLVAAVPEAGAVDLPWSHTEQVNSIEPPTWRGNVSDVLVLRAVAHLSFQVPTLALGTAFRGGDLTAWWGTSETISSHNTPASDNVFQGGEVYLYETEFEVPVGGLIAPPGEPLRLLVAGYLATTAAEALQLIIGPESYVAFEAAANPFSAPVWAETELWQGSGADCVEDPRTVRYAFEVVDVNTSLRFTLDKTAGAGHPDLDLFVYGPDGGYIAGAHGPGGHETLDLWPPALTAGPGTYSARIVGYCVGDIEFDLRMYESPSQPAS
jgi:hypothetical protein